jgi:hypothetical protein
MEEEILKSRGTYTAGISPDPFWACPVEGSQISHPHEVGMTEDRVWKHVWADFYSSSPLANC